MQNNREMIIKAIQIAGIIPIAEIEIPNEDPFLNIVRNFVKKRPNFLSEDSLSDIFVSEVFCI